MKKLISFAALAALLALGGSAIADLSPPGDHAAAPVCQELALPAAATVADSVEVAFAVENVSAIAPRTNFIELTVDQATALESAHTNGGVTGKVTEVVDTSRGRPDHIPRGT